MEEHEDRDTPSIDKSSLIVVDSTVTARLGGGEGKTEEKKRDEGEDMMVDVVGADDHGHGGDNFVSKAVSVQLVQECTQKATQTHDSGKDVCHDSASFGSRDLTFQKVEVTAKEQGLDTSLEASRDVLRDSDRVLSSEKVEVAVKEEDLKTSLEVSGDVLRESDGDARKSETCVRDSESSRGEPQLGGGDIAVIDSKEPTERGLPEVVVEQTVECAEEVALEQNIESVAEVAAEQNVEPVSEMAVEQNVESVSEVAVNVESVSEVAVEHNVESVSEVAVEHNVESVSEVAVEHNKESVAEVAVEHNVESVAEVAVEQNAESVSEVAVEQNIESVSEVAVEQKVESVEEVGGGDLVMDGNSGKEAVILDSLKIVESLTTTAKLGSQEVDMIAAEEGFASKDEAQDNVSKDPSLVCANTQNSSAEVVITETVEFAERSKEESLHPTIEVGIDDSQRKENGTIYLEEEPERGLCKEITKQPMGCDQQVADGDCLVNEEIENKSQALDSSKISEPLTTTSPGFEDVDVVVVDERLSCKEEAQDGVSVDPSLVCADNRSLSTAEDDANVQAENLDQQAEVDKLSQNQSSHPTTEAITDNAQKPEVGNGVEDSKLAAESSNGDPQFGVETSVKDRQVTERGLIEDEEIVEQHTESVLEVTYRDDVMDDKTGKGDVGLDSSKIPESLTTTNLGPEEVLTTNTEAQDSDAASPRLVCPDNGSSSTKVVNGFEEVNGVTPCADVAKDCVLHEGSDFSYEDTHMERGEDAGMDIDEVLGWKDEMPEIDVLSGNADRPETDQELKINANSEGGMEQGLLESSCEPVVIGQREENCKSRQPIVYERRAHVEVPLYDSLDGSRSPLLEDENLKVETDSEEDDESVQEEEKKAVGRSTNEVTEPLEDESSCSLQQSRYFRPREKGKFAVSDLVWGKIRSHPWWPGQIFSPSDASEKAMRYHKKDCFLVAYFGDGTFAWNDSAVLKPFRPNFSQIEKNTNLESFKNAVRCALEEVSRRVELGLACSCVPQEIYDTIKYQNVENGGIRRKSNRRLGGDESAGVSSFEPDKLVDYVRRLAQFPGEGDNMEVVMAKAQLSSYGHYKGYRKLPEFQFCGDILEEDASMLSEGDERVNNHGAEISEKIENNLVDGEYPNKDRSLSDLTDDAPYSGDGDRTEGGNVTSSLVSSSSGLKKRKARDSISSGSKKRPTLRVEKVPSALVSTPKPSFRVGECIQRVASQLTGPPSVLKSNSDPNGQHADQLVGPAVSLHIPENSETERMIVESKQSSVAEMLSQLQLLAQDPMKGYSFLDTITPFFYDRRTAVFSKSIRQHSSVVRPVSGKKRKTSNENEPEEFEFEFDDVNDSYWTDRIIQNHSEEQLLQDNQNEGQECHVVAYEPEKPAKASRRPYKKRVVSSNHEVESKEQSELVERRRQNLATEVVLKFTEGIYFPSEIHLNKMFRRFGALMESETEVDRANGRARVVFKKCSDAEVAHSSAGKFNIFGSINVNYELNYTPLVSYKPLPLPMMQDPMDAS